MLYPLGNPVEDAEQYTELGLRLQVRVLDFGRRIRRWIVVHRRRVGLGVSIPPTLPEIVTSRFKILESVVAPQPPNVESDRHYR